MVSKFTFRALLLAVCVLGAANIKAQIITTIAGGGGGDDNPATATGLTPDGVAVDAAGNVYIADANAHRIRKINTIGIITTVAGMGAGGYSGDGGLATDAQLRAPRGVAIDAGGNIYIADGGNYVIRK